ncbi:MAG: hypothetical protein EOM24_07060 [Chloroflexia bacterium]|nr:hypothetical protein [Chloroflexia bacterium]
MKFISSLTPVLMAYLIGGMLYNAGAAQVPEIISRRTVQPPVIDGRLDESAWHSAEKVDQFFRYNSDDLAPISSVVYLMHDDQALYLGMIMMKSVGQPVKGQLWQDCVEVFVDPGRSREDCFQMAFAIDRDIGIAYQQGGTDLDWESGAQWAAREIPLGWMLEVSIPFDNLGAEIPAEGATWGLLVCRNDVDAGRTTLAPIRGAFRQPQLFCGLTLTGTSIPAHSRDETPVPLLAARIADSRQAAESLTADNPAGGPILERLGELTRLADAIEHEAVTQPVIASVLRRWAHDSIAVVLEDSIDWQIRLSRLLFIPQPAS